MVEVKALAKFIQWRDLQIINETLVEEVDQGQGDHVCAQHLHCLHDELHQIHDYLAIVLFLLSSLNCFFIRPIIQLKLIL